MRTGKCTMISFLGWARMIFSSCERFIRSAAWSIELTVCRYRLLGSVGKLSSSKIGCLISSPLPRSGPPFTGAPLRDFVAAPLSVLAGREMVLDIGSCILFIDKLLWTTPIPRWRGVGEDILPPLRRTPSGKQETAWNAASPSFGAFQLLGTVVHTVVHDPLLGGGFDLGDEDQGDRGSGGCCGSSGPL